MRRFQSGRPLGSNHLSQSAWLLEGPIFISFSSRSIGANSRHMPYLEFPHVRWFTQSAFWLAWSTLSGASHQTRCQTVYVRAGILTFSSSYLMVFFICQTNVRNTIPQAQSLWHHSQLFLLPFRAPFPPHREQRSSEREKPAILQLSVKAGCRRELAALLHPKGETITE